MLHGLLWLPLIFIFVLLTALGWLERRRQNLFRNWANGSELCKLDSSGAAYLKQKIQTLSKQSCMALNVNIFARVDFFLEKGTNNIYLNEINTIPGFTTNSMFPLLWRSSGLEINELVAKIIEYCL